MYYIIWCWIGGNEILAEVEADSLSEAFGQIDSETWERYQNVWFGSEEEARRLGLI